ncbi:MULTISPECIES: oligoendopeptidase F [Ramlibacter]|uniref:Oligopeptidase F n=1 Tax=Ramlibacter aquaticus TaxID=2780094 RepID=A0ABR9SBP7_9BURK|nr:MULTISPECIES: oligoendopeptidase F [Ramlibacter]MBE7939753.1 oligoendopeptidase F [Ramlibacter aquaticus]
MNKPLTRAEVAPEQTWNLQDLYATREAWLAEMAALEADLSTVTRHQGRLASAAATLLACLDARDRLLARLQRATTFAALRNAQDGGDPQGQADLAHAAAVEARVRAALKFVDTEILAMPEADLQGLRAAEPGLAVHRTELDELARLRPHMLSAETERVLAALGEVLHAPLMTYERSKSGDLRFEPFTAAGREHPNSFNLYEWSYEGSADVQVRRAAWASFCKGLVPYQNTYAATFATEISKNIVLARARGYDSTEQFLLHGHQVPFALYSNVLDTIQAELAPHMRRYARLRQRVLGLDRLLYCDIKAPLDADYAPALDFTQAAGLIQAALAPMGEDYQALVREAFERRWIDRADNLGKSSGAFCASPYGVHPYILMTWTGTMRDAFVLVHELGHAGHFLNAQRHQRFVNTRPSMPFVEAPSIMNEVLLARHILQDERDARMRRWVLMQVLGTYHHNFVTHLLEAELQRQVYRLAEGGQSVTAAMLNERKAAILRGFWGDAVVIDEGAAMTWMRQPHYYLGLYPYTYSVGLVAATALAEKARLEGDGVFAGWLQVLRAGGTLPPLDLMRQVGIDLASPEPVRAAVAHVGRMVDELEASF